MKRMLRRRGNEHLFLIVGGNGDVNEEEKEAEKAMEAGESELGSLSVSELG